MSEFLDKKNEVYKFITYIERLALEAGSRVLKPCLRKQIHILMKQILDMIIKRFTFSKIGQRFYVPQSE